MNHKSLQTIAKQAHSCRCNFCLLEKAREIIQRQGSQDLSLVTAVRLIEDLLRSGSGTASSVFPTYQTANLRPSGDQSGSRLTVEVQLPEDFEQEEEYDNYN
jgi:hypothetical protein